MGGGITVRVEGGYFEPMPCAVPYKRPVRARTPAIPFCKHRPMPVMWLRSAP